VAPRLSVSQITTLRSSFAEDVRDHAAAGLAGTGAHYPDSFWAAPAVQTLNRAQAAFEHRWSGGPPSAAPRRLTVKESR